MGDPIENIAIPGFDDDGNPEIRRMADGSFWLVFNFMPPSWLPESEDDDLGVCADFDRQLEKAINVPVLWDDRELFFIKTPGKDTIELVKKFLARFREMHDV